MRRATPLVLAAAVGTAAWLRRRPPPRGYRRSLPWRAFDGAASGLDARYGWDRLPKPLALAVLVGVRNVLRQENLHDTEVEPRTAPAEPGPAPPGYRTRRSADGSYNDLSQPYMGMAGSRFGRNVALDLTMPEERAGLLDPNPRVVSRELMTRETFQPATSINSLAAAWLQFMVRDWMSHGRGPNDRPFDLEPVPGDTWPEPPVRIMRTRDDPTRPPRTDGRPPTYANTESHWWDGSQIYGSSAEAQHAVRSGRGGKLHVGTSGIVPLPPEPDRNPALTPGFWLGVAMMGGLFALEHNAICDRLADAYPAWSDEDLFQGARLVNSALLAKIHTVEWTPAVISHPTTVTALRANWFGVAGERIRRRFGRLGDSEILSGIPGSPTQHYGVPYSLTEEFVAVYRMHPLIRDDYSFRSALDDASVRECTFQDINGPGGQSTLEGVGLRDALYSFGTLHPGAIVLHNFPHFLQEFRRPTGELQDLAATDILRSREAGVPRWNEFRRLLHVRPARSFDDLVIDPAWGEEMRRVYRGDLERVDLTVGLFAEKRPAGFAFSDTAFRIFILMASRRLNSDRFFTVDYTPEVYTPEGLDWIADTTMSTVLTRHFPELGRHLDAVENAFAPWPGARA